MHAALMRVPRSAPLVASLPIGTGVGRNLQVSPSDGMIYDTPLLATNPANPSNELSASVAEQRPPLGGFRSVDNGASWTPTIPPLPVLGPNQFAIGPGVAFDSSGDAYVGSLDVSLTNTSNGTFISTQVTVATSRDTALTWGPADVAASSADTPDAPLLAIDSTRTATSHPNRLYLGYDTNPSGISQPLMVARSNNGVSWSPVKVWDSGGDVGADPAIGPNGEVYVAWDDYCGGVTASDTCQNPNGRIVLARSSDGGATFNSPTTIASTAIGFGEALPNYGVCNGQATEVLLSPAIAVDRSVGTHAGTLYAVWADQQPTTDATAPRMHIYFSRSTDGGAHWSGRIRLDTGNANDAWQPALAVDQQTGAVTISWYDRRDDSNNHLYRVYYTQSTDRGLTFPPAQVAISDVQSDPMLDCIGTGEHAGISANNGAAHPVWTDTRNGLDQIFTTSIDEAAVAQAVHPSMAFTAGASATPYAFSAPVLGDLNGDGIPDEVFDSGTGLSVAMGNGDGTFQPAVLLNSNGLTAASPILVDLRRNGHLDIVAVNSSLGYVLVFLGNGDGTFQSAARYPIAGPTSVVAADFNGDGIPDLAVASTSVSMLLGNGDGSFRNGPSFPLGGGAVGMVAADFNHDGKMDLAIEVANSRTDLPPSLDIAVGNGDGSFQAPQAYPAGPSNGQLISADFNHDGFPDLAVANSGIYATQGQLSILLNDGTGKLLPPVPYLSGIDIQSMVAADFHGTGATDLAVTTGQGPGQIGAGGFGITILDGFGNGTFAVGPTYVGLTGGGLAAGDLNRDGHIDLLEASWVLLGNGDGTFQGTRSVPAGSGPGAMVSGDFNGDGKLDLAVTNSNGGLSILLGKGDGSFQSPQAVALPQAAVNVPSTMVAADFNLDGHLDLAVLTWSSPSADVAVLLGKGDGTFQTAVSYSVGTYQPVGLAVGDLNGDGKPDLVVAAAATMYVLLNDGSGGFTAGSSISAGAALGPPAIGDFNGDGKADLVLGFSAGGSCCGLPGMTQLYLGHGDGTFTASTVLNSSQGQIPVAADINGDGKLDVIGFVQDGISGSAYLGNGDGTFTEVPNAGVSGGTDALVTDIDGDGIPDLIELTSYYGWVKIQRGHGDGSFDSPEYYVAGTNPTALAAGDFDHDGRLDIVAADSPSNAVAVMLRLAPSAGLRTSKLDFGSTAWHTVSAPQTEVITNTGTFPMKLAMAFVTGAGSGAFTKTSDSCSGTTLLPGLSCSVAIDFGPKLPIHYAATLTLVVDATGSPQGVPLSGLGFQAPPAAAVSTSAAAPPRTVVPPLPRVSPRPRRTIVAR